MSTLTGFKILIKVLGECCWKRPDISIRLQNSNEDPSRIGISPPITSTSALSMPVPNFNEYFRIFQLKLVPNKAAIKCSTVEILHSFERLTFVQYKVFDTIYGEIEI